MESARPCAVPLPTVLDGRYSSVPMTMVSAPVSGSTVKPICAVKSITGSEKAEARSEEDPDANWRDKDDRSRRWWRCIVVTPSRSLVRLNHISAGVRAGSYSKHECQNCQSHYETFFSHNQRVPPVVSAIEPDDDREVSQEKNGGDRI